MPTWIFDFGPMFEDRPRLAADAHEDAPLDLETACWLPELCQPDELFGRAPLWTAAALRGAHERGELVVEWHGRRMFVTKRLVREWRERCRTPPRSSSAAPGPAAPPPSPAPSARPAEATRTFGGAPADPTPTASTAPAAGGSFTAASKSEALAAVMARIRNAKRSGR
ncbi:DNA-binding protein [Methylobacterium sp. DB1607]|nr:DNA-binding protein [Methylobacterium sp. DB1607]